MKACAVTLCFLVGAIHISAFSASTQQPEPKPNDPKKAGQLVDRCQKLADMQLALCKGTTELDKTINSNTDKKSQAKDKEAALKLADKAKEMHAELTKIADALEADGAAVAFLELFQELRKDMKHVERRLEKSDVGAVTQAIQQDILETLRELVAGLKKG